MRQLIQLRWIAVAGQTVAIVLADFGLGVPLPLFWMLSVAAALGGANLIATLAVPRYRVRDADVMFALLLDMGALTLQLYLSGGAANPFVSLFLLQVVLGAMLLRPAAGAVLYVASMLSYAFLTLRSLPLVIPNGSIRGGADIMAVGHWIAFAMVAGLLVRFIARISRNLRARDAHVADLRQHVAEEEGIVRMGLFASGAAHELGTPLATLSVILADWRRMPEISGNADLVAEVGEMQAEVQRCKAIVSDILHSAGQPRGEAMTSALAAGFLETAVREWHLTQPDVRLDYQGEGLAAVVIPVDPALRQAVWNLLDNSAEVSPEGVEVQARLDRGMLVVAVRDRGPGFAPDALRHVGQLYRSTKGAGHGLGLFLATNVARRLGGRLEASNRDGGGAEVRLILPLGQREPA